MKNENIFKQAVDHFGVENQLLKLVEEMAELTKEILKNHFEPNNPKHFNNLIEEFVDVQILMNQISYSKLFETEIANDLLRIHYKRKLERLEKLLETTELTKDKI